MYIRKAIYKTDRRTYTRHLLVESESTPEGSRQKTVCWLGSLSPGPRKKWLALARKLLAALEGGPGTEPEPPGGVTVHPPRKGIVKPGPPAAPPEAPAIDPERIRAEQALEAGPVLAGHAVWDRLEAGAALSKAGLPPLAVKLAEMVALDLLTAPKPGAPLVHRARQTVLPRILGEEPEALASMALYRQLDLLPAKRAVVEQALAAAEKRLFDHGAGGLIFDFRGITFAPAGGAPATGGGTAPPTQGKGAAQGRMEATTSSQAASALPAAGLVLDELGFVRAHEPLGGYGKDRPALGAAIRLLGRRSGTTAGAVVVLDREAATPANLSQVRKLGHRCLVTGDESAAAPHAAPGTASAPGAAKAPPKAGQGDVGMAESDRVHAFLAAHDERLALLSGPDAGAFVLDQLPLAAGTRLFLLLLAGRLLNAAELLLDRGGIRRPWHAIREVLRRHQAVTLSIPFGDGTTRRLERETGPDAEQAALYRVLGVEKNN